MNPEEFRTAGHRLIDWIADYRLRVAKVLRDYGMTDRAEVPQDSCAAHPS